MAKEKETEIKIPAITPKITTLHIVGDTDLVLNKMDDRTKRDMILKQKEQPKDMSKANYWEKVVTSLHWYGGEPSLRFKPKDYTEQTLIDLLKNDAPCIDAYGFKRQCAAAVVRFKIDKNKTGFMATVHVITNGTGLIPIKFTEHFLDEDMVPTNTISKVPVLSTTNRFSGWSADVTLSYFDNLISIESLVNIVNLTGRGIGIGSRKNEDYGQFHVETAT